MSTKIGMQFDSDAGYVGCGLQICSHPACWEAAKRINRELQIKNFAHSRKKLVIAFPIFAYFTVAQFILLLQ